MNKFDIEEFKRVNKLTNKDIADYLGVSSPYISMVATGQTFLSNDKISKLSEHPTWDTSIVPKLMSQSSPLVNFLLENKISRKQIAEYLGVSVPFISQIIKGQRGLPNEKLQRLLDHPTWDTAPLLNIARAEQPTYEHPLNLPPTAKPINLPVATEDDVIEAEIVEIPIVPTAVVRQPDTQLSKWVDKCAGDAERLRFGEILANATIAREVKELDMAPDLKVGQYICLELLPHDTPIKNGKIYFIDHSQLGGFFRKLYDRGDNILCRARNRSYEDFTIDKAHIYDLYRIVGVFSTDVIEDPRDEQIDHFMEQTNHLLEQHDAHNANIEKLIDNTHRLVEQQGVLISAIVNKKEK